MFIINISLFVSSRGHLIDIFLQINNSATLGKINFFQLTIRCFCYFKQRSSRDLLISSQYLKKSSKKVIKPKKEQVI